MGVYFFDEYIQPMRDIIFEKNNILYEIEIFVIMPNHIHLLLKQIADFKEIIKYLIEKENSGITTIMIDLSEKKNIFSSL